MATAVVCGRENCEELASSEALEAVHDAFVSTEDIFSFIVIKELFHTIGTELHDVASAVRVSNEVRLNAKLAIVVSGVAPQDVDDELLLRCRDFMDNLKRSLDHFNLLN